MKYTGSVPNDSLSSDSVFNFIRVLSRDKETSFEVEEDLALAVAEEISRTLKPGSRFATVRNEYDTIVAFVNKLFRFAPNEKERRQKAVDYAKTLGIKETEISF